MLKYFGSQTRHGYEVVDKLPNVDDVRVNQDGVKEKCLIIKPAFYGYKYANTDENYAEYAPYLVTWEEMTEDGEETTERICVRRNNETN